MRTLPALGLLLLVLLTCAGCSVGIWRAGSSPAAKTPPARVSAKAADEKTPAGPRSPSRRRVSPIDVSRPADLGAPSWGESGATVSAEIARRIEAAQAEWRQHCEAVKCTDLPALLGREGAVSPGEASFTDKPISESVLAAERKYAAEILNCRLRVSVLKARLADADPSTEPMLRRKIEEAESRLAAAEEACRAEGESGAPTMSSVRFHRKTIGDAVPVSGR